ncbi:MAG: hypothetical protein ABIP06_15345 [Pyrinomonadaceae bacterium]
MSNKPKTNYIKQDRGTLSEYEEYFAGMDASMQQKIALTTARNQSNFRTAKRANSSKTATK